ncbi:hypothetical protein MRB53_014586 [Persea americana]|uniref:Uncharacterized protein n=1 Tax=Persea americana TaxID=3435 RepID=A0ACC2KB59_PERAE|nr:hypothetical protein MRB53_014586 [Persea americana]
MKLLQITPESNSKRVDMRNQVGRVLHNETFKLWSKKTSKVASFSTTFELFIQRVNKEPCGEGMAFILTNNPSLPTNSHGQWLGIVNETTNGASLNGIVAIEFDTRKSSPDDIDDNHVAVDVNGIKSIRQFPLVQAGVNLSSGSNVVAKIQYDGDARNLTVYVSMLHDSEGGLSSPLITLDINLSQYLMEDVYVGFSGSTGNLTQLNYVYSWDFTSTNVTDGDSWTTKKEKGNNLELILPLVLSTACLICGSLCYLWWRRKRIGNNGGYRVSPTLVSMLENSSQGPQKYLLKELKAATSNFNPINKLGQGGFGTVYKGILKDGEEVAVKRVSKDSRQGEQEFAAEVMTISHLSHKNLVRLIGWCLERDDLLLVYEFMPNGSLDKLIFSSEKSSSKNAVLSWERRHKIICGVASALCYLHDGCRNRVLHRDVKSSNVMLDSNYDARLGDFGLARTIQHADSETCHLTTKIAGTPGYIAPECLLTGRASVKTDVYGFGVFAMEVTCGRRPGNNLRNPEEKGNSIMDWLWDLYGRERVLEAVDPQLHGVFDKEQMELVLKLGLACCHPNPNERPSMRLVLQVLNGEAPAPVLPIEKPTFMWPLMPSNLGAAPISFEEPSSGGGRLTMSMDLSAR